MYACYRRGPDFTDLPVCLVHCLNIETKLLCFLEVEFVRLLFSERQLVKWVEVLENLLFFSSSPPPTLLVAKKNNAVTMEAVIEHSFKTDIYLISMD